MSSIGPLRYGESPVVPALLPLYGHGPTTAMAVIGMSRSRLYVGPPVSLRP
jgi:hypothetical protein